MQLVYMFQIQEFRNEVQNLAPIIYNQLMYNIYNNKAYQSKQVGVG